jgi:hypothetical protein
MRYVKLELQWPPQLRAPRSGISLRVLAASCFGAPTKIQKLCLVSQSYVCGASSLHSLPSFLKGKFSCHAIRQI